MGTWHRTLKHEIEELKEHEKKGCPLSWDIVSKLGTAYDALKILEKMEEETEEVESYKSENGSDYKTMTVENHYHHENGAKEVAEIKEEVKFCHTGKCATEIDVEMERVLNIPHDVAMERLSSVLAEHFGDLETIAPKLYEKLLKDMKDIK